jgi:uncharacterized protein with HEPN domain
MRRDAAYLHDTLHASRNALSFTSNLTEQLFLESELHQSAVVRQFEIIGEAAKKVSDDTRSANPHIPWKKMAGLRDVLMHAYDTVDVKMVWRLVKEDLPSLIEALEPLVSGQGPD